MAACDVWKQTHTKFKKVSSSATQDNVSELVIQDSVSSHQDQALNCEDSQSNSFWSSELVSNSIFITINGSVIDSYDTGDDDSDTQFVEYWNDKEYSFQLRLGEKLHRNIFNDLLFQGQVDLFDDTQDSNQDSDDDCGMMCSDNSEDENYNYFEYTHYNCIPTWEMERQQHEIMVQNDYHTIDVLKHNVEDKTCGAHSVSPAQSNSSLSKQPISDVYGVSITETKVNNNSVHIEQIKMMQQQHQLAAVEQQQYQLAEATHNKIQINNDPCTIRDENNNAHSVAPGQLDGDLYGGSAMAQTETNFDIDGEHDAPIEIVQQKYECMNKFSSGDECDASVEKLELEIQDGLFIPSTFNSCTTTINDPFCDEVVKQDDIKETSPDFIAVNETFCDFETIQVILPSGFYPLQEFVDIIIHLECRFDRIGVSLSLNQLEMVFVNNNNDEYVYRPFIMNDDLDFGGEFTTLKRLLCILEDLDIEYSDNIGISSYIDLKVLFLDKLLIPRVADLRSLNADRIINTNSLTINCDSNNKFQSHYTKKRGKKQRRYKWIAKNCLQNPKIKNFGVQNNDSSIYRTSSINNHNNKSGNHSSLSSSDYHCADGVGDIYKSQSNSFHGTLCNITARAPPCDPDIIT